MQVRFQNPTRPWVLALALCLGAPGCGFTAPETSDLGVLLGLPSAATSTFLGLPDTGQNQCTDSTGNTVTCGFSHQGQDADFISQPAALSFRGSDQVVTESTSGLTWQRCSHGQTLEDGGLCQGAPIGVNATNAVSICTALSLNGLTWRVPTMRELMLWPHYRYSDPVAEPALFPGTPANTTSLYWSTTAPGADGTKRWTLRSEYGRTAADDESGSGFVRCVSGSSMPAASFSVQDTGTVYDSTTNLLWTRCSMAAVAAGSLDNSSNCGSTPGTGNWADALNACTNLTHAGRSDWRLPSVRELTTLLDHSKTVQPLTDQVAFPNTGSSYWTSTSRAGASASSAHDVTFTDGTTDTSGKSSTLNVRCVATGLTP